MGHKRIEWIDVAKGIGIILVVLGHTSISPNLVKYIFSFHMPLFFFLSGYLFSFEKYANFPSFLKTKANSILIPYITFSVISVFAFSVIVEGNLDISEITKAFFISKRNEIFYNVPLWFFTSLFLVQVLYYLLKKYIKNNILILLTSFILSSVSIYVLKTIEQPKLPWTFDAVLYYLLFFCIGNIISERNSKNISLNKTIRYLIFGISLSINIVLLVMPYKINFIFNIISNYRILEVIWYPLIGLAGILSVVLISGFLKSSKTINFLGRNSLIVFSLHVPFGLCIIDKLLIIFNVNPPQPFNVWGIIETIFIFIILWPIINLINKYFPFILGKRRKVAHASSANQRVEI